jgi:hypothetical protein
MKMLQKKMADVAKGDIEKKGKRKDPLAFLNKHKHRHTTVCKDNTNICVEGT